MKTAIVILSDPKSCSDESLGRVFNALTAAYDFKNAGQEVTVLFQGAGARWPEALQKEDHPAHELFASVGDKMQGISCGCEDVFGANPSGFDLLKDNQVPNTSGLPSLNNLQRQGYNVLTF